MALGDLRGLDGSTQAGPIGAWARQTETRLRDVLQVSAANLAEAIIAGNQYSSGTPVDTGYARASWIVSIGSPSNALPAGPPPKHGTAPGTYDAPDSSAIAYAWDGDQPLYITNNVVYVPALEYGHTVAKNAGTPPGWVGQAVHQWATIIGDATRQARAETRGAANAQSASAFASLVAAGTSGGNA